MEPTPAAPPPNSSLKPVGPGWLAGAGLLAGGAVSLVMLRWYPFFLSGVTVTLVRPTDEEIATLERTELLNNLAAFGLLGGALGVAFAIATAASRRSPRLAAAGLVSGLVLGAAGGALGGWCAAELVHALSQMAGISPKFRTYSPAIARACGWGLVGLGAGLGFSLPLANRRAIVQMTVGALVGGLIAAPCYQVIVGVVGMFSRVDGTENLVPYQGAVVLAAWLVTAGVVIGLAAGLAGSASSRKKLEVKH